MTSDEQAKYDKLRQDSWDKALYSFGCNYLFGKRIMKYSRLNRILKFSGILIPVVIGAIAATYYGNVELILEWAIILLAPLGIVQLILSLWAIIWDWDNELSYAFEASQHYSYLGEEFKKLGNTPPLSLSELEQRSALLAVEYNTREQRDLKHAFKDEENRMGMRAGLRQFQRQCAGCNVKPLSMKPTDCDVCGNF